MTLHDFIRGIREIRGPNLFECPILAQCPVEPERMNYEVAPGQTRSHSVKPGRTPSNPVAPRQTRSHPVKPGRTWDGWEFWDGWLVRCQSNGPSQTLIIHPSRPMPVKPTHSHPVAPGQTPSHQMTTSSRLNSFYHFFNILLAVQEKKLISKAT
jgi:hypothetical protein